MQKNTVAMDNYPLSSIYELLKLSKKVRQNIKKVSEKNLRFGQQYTCQKQQELSGFFGRDGD